MYVCTCTYVLGMYILRKYILRAYALKRDEQTKKGRWKEML